MKNIILLIQFFIPLFLFSCSSGNEENSFVFGKGKYKFTMSDSLGKKMIDGNLIVSGFSGNNISGTYDFRNVYAKDFEGLSTMNGKFEGNIIPESKTVFINTNPRIADSNVFWNLKVKENSVSGEWNYSVFRGALNKGKIKITK